MAYSDPLNPIGEVRFLIGDTDTNAELFSDVEVAYALQRKSDNVRAAAAMLARQLAGSLPLRFTGYKLADYQDPKGADMAKAYMALALRLEGEAIAAAGADGIYAGGISVADKEAVASNTDRVKPAFARGMHDNQGTSTAVVDEIVD